MRLRSIAAVLALGALACGSSSDATGAASDDVTAVQSRALDAAERALEEGGDADADDAMTAALRSTGAGPADADVIRWRALRELLREEWLGAPAIVRADAAALREATLSEWRKVAAWPQAERLGELAALAHFDPSQPTSLITQADAEQAAQQPEAGLDAREATQLQAAQRAVYASLGQHLDLARAEAERRAAPLAAVAQGAARQAALALAGAQAWRPSDVVIAAGLALRRTWRSFADRDQPDDAWPLVARTLGLPRVPFATSARPRVTIDDGGGLACEVDPLGLSCAGRASRALRVTLDGVPHALGVAGDATAQAALSALADALAAPFAGCLISASAAGDQALLRIDRADPHATPAGSPDAQRLLAVSATSISEEKIALQGRFAESGWRPIVDFDFQGNELRLRVRAARSVGAGGDFETAIGLPQRLPARFFEVEIVDADGVLRAAGRLDHRAAAARDSAAPAFEGPSTSASAAWRAGKWNE